MNGARHWAENGDRMIALTWRVSDRSPTHARALGRSDPTTWPHSLTLQVWSAQPWGFLHAWTRDRGQRRLREQTGGATGKRPTAKPAGRFCERTGTPNGNGTGYRGSLAASRAAWFLPNPWQAMGQDRTATGLPTIWEVSPAPARAELQRMT